MREPDLVWETLIEVCNADDSQMTKSERGRYNKAVKELKEVGATPDDIRARAGRFRSKWPNLTVTPTALSAHWSSLAPPPRREPAKSHASPVVPAILDDPEPERMTDEERAEGIGWAQEILERHRAGRDSA